MRKNNNRSTATRVVLTLAAMLFTASANLQAQEPSPAAELLYARSALNGDGTGDWMFQGRAGQTVVVTAASDDFDTVVELWSQAGEIMATDDDGGSDTNSRLVATLPADGRYRVSVHAYAWGSDNPSGAYDVAVHVVAQAPVVEPVVEIEMPEDLSLYARGFLNDDGTGDWMFQGRAGHTVMVTAASDDFDTVVELWSQAGEIMATDDDGGSDTNSRLVATLPADGRYRVSVHAYAWGSDNPSGAYDVAVRMVDSTPNPVSERVARRHDNDGVWNSSLQGRDLLRYVPPEVTGVVFVDVDALVNSDIYQRLAASPLMRDALREMQEEAGFDLEDIDRLIAGVDIDGGRDITVLAGRFDQTSLEALAQQNDGVEARDGDRRWFRFDGDNAMAILEPGVIAVGAEPFVIRALDPPAAGSGIESNARLLHLLRQVPPDSTLWGAAHFDEPELGIAGLAGGVRFDDGVHGTLTVEAPDEVAGDRLRTQIEMLQTMANLAATSPLEQNLIDAFQVAAADNGFTIEFALPTDLLQELLTAAELTALPEGASLAAVLAPFNGRMTHTD